MLDCCRHAAGMLLWLSARRDEVLVRLNAPTHPRKTRPALGLDFYFNMVLVSTIGAEGSHLCAGEAHGPVTEGRRRDDGVGVEKML